MGVFLWARYPCTLSVRTRLCPCNIARRKACALSATELFIQTRVGSMKVLAPAGYQAILGLSELESPLQGLLVNKETHAPRVVLCA